MPENSLENAIQRYEEFGYELISQAETTATMERRAPIVATYMIAAILLIWPAAILYAIPGARRLYRVELKVNPDGRAEEFGGTIKEFTRDVDRSNTRGWTLIGLAMVLVICFILLQLRV